MAQSFVTKAILGGRTEVTLGQVATHKARSARLRSFGAKMVRDHGRSGRQLAVIAKQEGLSVPVRLDEKRRREIERFARELPEGVAWDRAYWKHQVRAHKKTISLFEHARKTVRPSSLRTFINATLPTVKAHLRLLFDIQHHAPHRRVLHK